MSAAHSPQAHPHLTTDHARLAGRLVERLRRRSTARSVVWTLDLRSDEFGQRGRINLYAPRTSGWPLTGATTGDRETAIAWIYAEGGYAQWLSRELLADRSNYSGDVRVATAADRYIDWLIKTRGPTHNTTVNRTSCIRAHIVPALGDLPLNSLNRRSVRPFLESLEVMKSVGGTTYKLPASLETRDFVRAALLAIWNHAFPDDGCPFNGIKLDDAKGKRTRRDAIIAGDVLDLEPVRTLTSEGLQAVFLAARWYDRHIIQFPRYRATFVPLTTEVVVLLYATGMRVSELARLQWRHVLLERGAIIVPGIKSDNALRVIPLQNAARCWFERLERQAVVRKRFAPRDFVVAMGVHASNNESSTSNQIIQRVGEVLQLSGYKVPGKATHMFRHTHTTMAAGRTDLIDAESLKVYLGHEEVYGGETDVYVDRKHVELTIARMPPAHRGYIDLPTPEQIEAKLATYSPPEMVGMRYLKDVEEGRRSKRREAILAAGGRVCERRSTAAPKDVVPSPVGNGRRHRVGK